MNRHLKRVFATYALAVMAAFIYPPWHAPGSAAAYLRYAFVWDPPGQVQVVVIDYTRIFLEVVTLTLVLLLALISLWGEDG